jgi:hypothetical protein
VGASPNSFAAGEARRSFHASVPCTCAQTGASPSTCANATSVSGAISSFGGAASSFEGLTSVSAAAAPASTTIPAATQISFFIRALPCRE